MAVSHWHVATGLRGYGPDDPGPAYEDVLAAAEAASYEARQLSEFEYEGYMILKDSEMWEDAVHAMESCERFENLAANLDFSESRRGKAPLFTGPGRLQRMRDAALYEMSQGAWPYDGGRYALYVWECVSEECEEDDDD